MIHGPPQTSSTPATPQQPQGGRALQTVKSQARVPPPTSRAESDVSVLGSRRLYERSRLGAHSALGPTNMCLLLQAELNAVDAAAIDPAMSKRWADAVAVSLALQITLPAANVSRLPALCRASSDSIAMIARFPSLRSEGGRASG